MPILTAPGPFQQGGVYTFTVGAGNTPPAGYDWVTYNGEIVVFTGFINGVAFVNEPVMYKVN